MKRLFKLFLSFMIGICLIPPDANAQAAADAVVFSQQELDQMLAPIALYPDPLLSQILIAATYPLEAVQAARFVKQNSSLGGDELARALEAQPWDASVKALVQFPAVLIMMDEQLTWTQKLGDAFLAQQDAVMDTVQSLRAKAQAAGTLRSNQQQRLVAQDGAIAVEPNLSGVIYVPYYNPTVVYGRWWWPAYPPMAWAPSPAYWSPNYGDPIASGIAFGIGIVIVNSTFIDRRPDWRRHHFIMGRGPERRSGEIWTHNPAHRHGVNYRDLPTTNRFRSSAGNTANREQNREHHREHADVASKPLPVIIAPRERERLPRVELRPELPAHPVMRPPTEPAASENAQSSPERGRSNRDEFGPNQTGARHEQYRR